MLPKDTAQSDQWLVSYMDDLLADGCEPEVQPALVNDGKSPSQNNPPAEEPCRPPLPNAMACQAQWHEPVATSSIEIPGPDAVVDVEQIADEDGSLKQALSSVVSEESPEELSQEIPRQTPKQPSMDDVLAPPEPQRKVISAASQSQAINLQYQEQLERKQRVEKLLREATIQPKVVPSLESPAATEVAPVTARTAIEAPPEIELAPTQPQVEILAPPVSAVAQVEASQTDTGLRNQWQDGRPVWAQQRFDVLLFSVSKLTLAVPLIALGQIQKLSDDLTPLFGQADWFMGVLPTALGKIRCVDTALFVMPERYQPEFRQNYRFVITIDGFPWGLAVDDVKQPIQLEPASVNWRGARSQRPWLAGTIKEHMCALIDVPMLGDILAKEDKNRTK